MKNQKTRLFYGLWTAVSDKYSILSKNVKHGVIVFNSPIGVDHLMISHYPGHPFYRVRNDMHIYIANRHLLDAVNETRNLRRKSFELTFHIDESHTVLNWLLENLYCVKESDNTKDMAFGTERGKPLSGYHWTTYAEAIKETLNFDGKGSWVPKNKISNASLSKPIPA